MKSQYLAKSIPFHILISAGINCHALIEDRMQITSPGDDASSYFSFNKPVWKSTTAVMQGRDQGNCAPRGAELPKRSEGQPLKSYWRCRLQSGSLVAGRKPSISAVVFLIGRLHLLANTRRLDQLGQSYTHCISFNSRGKKKKNLYSEALSPPTVPHGKAPANLGRLRELSYIVQIADNTLFIYCLKLPLVDNTMKELHFHVKPFCLVTDYLSIMKLRKIQT